MLTMRGVRWVVLLGCALLLAACSRDKGPAQQAITAAEAALNAAQPEAAKYVPDQVQSVAGALQGAKDAFAKGDYTAALNGAKDLDAKAKALTTAAAAKKEELTKQWDELSASQPKTLELLQAKVTALQKAKKLPAGLDKAKLEEANASVAALTQEWAVASDAFKAGNLMEAVDKGKDSQAKSAELMTTLGVQPATKP